MPELPDLLHIQARLEERIQGRRVTAQRVREPIVLRYAVRGDLALLVGQPLVEIVRRAHFLVFRFGGLDLCVNPMLAGRFRLAGPGDKDEPTLCFALAFEDAAPTVGPRRASRQAEAAPTVGPGRASRQAEAPELRYLDDKKMGKAYLTAAGEWARIPGMQGGGLDVLSAEFTQAAFEQRLRGRRDQVRLFLLDKRALDSLGNAYADEVLFEAGIHPKTWCRSLSAEDVGRLHAAIVKVMREAVEEVARRDEPIEVKVRDFLKVRRKEQCPRCGSKIRRAGVRGMDAYFCPRCQPATRAGLVEWTRTGR